MSSEKVSNAKRRLINSLPLVLLVVFVMLPAISRAIFSAWDCVPYDSGPGESKYILRIDESVVCDSPEHRGITTLAIFLVMIWPVGMQLLFFMVLYSNRKVLRAGKLNGMAKATRFLTGGYKQHVYYWETVELFRRLAVSGFLVLIPYEFIYWRIILALVVALPICLTTAIVQPFRRPEDNFLSLANQSMLCIAFLLCGLIRIVNEESITNAQKVDILGYSSSDGLFFMLCALIVGFCVLLFMTYGYKVYAEYLLVMKATPSAESEMKSSTIFVCAGGFAMMGLCGGGVAFGLTGGIVGALLASLIGGVVGSLSWGRCSQSITKLVGYGADSMSGKNSAIRQMASPRAFGEADDYAGEQSLQDAKKKKKQQEYSSSVAPDSESAEA